MTNKLPVVGKRYRNKFSYKTYLLRCIELDESAQPENFKLKAWFKNNIYGVWIEEFWNEYEELPEDKAENHWRDIESAPQDEIILLQTEDEIVKGEWVEYLNAWFTVYGNGNNKRIKPIMWKRIEDKAETKPKTPHEFMIDAILGLGQLNESEMALLMEVFQKQCEERIELLNKVKTKPEVEICAMCDKKINREEGVWTYNYCDKCNPENQSQKIIRKWEAISGTKFGSPEYYEWFRNKFKIDPETGEPIQNHNSELSPEVKEAMEKGKEEIKTKDPFGRKILSVEDYYRLRTCLFNLLNALDKQFREKESENCIHDVTEGFCRMCKEYVEKENEFDGDTNVGVKTGEECESEVAADEWNTTELKEESIWKPINELPEAPCAVFLKWIDRDVLLTNFSPRRENFSQLNNDIPIEKDDSRIVGFSRLKDFINDYEKLKERLKKLEGK